MLAFIQKPSSIALLCFLSGSLCALGMAPYNIWPIFIVGFCVLYWAIDCAQSKKAAFSYGWLWAFGYFVFSLCWIGNALLVEGNPYKWAWPLAVCGLPALLAFFNGFACLFINRFLNLKSIFGYFGFVSALSLSEYLRGHLFTGFPWNLYGYTWADMPIAQLARYESVYFLTFLTLFWMSFVGFWITGSNKLSKRVINTLILVSFFGSFYHATSILSRNARQNDTGIDVKIVQPNTNQSEKWQREKMDGHFQAALELSQPTGDEGEKNLIVWPETTLSPGFLNAPYYRGQISEMLSSYNGEAILMTGALRYEPEYETYHNSLLTIDKTGQIDRVYDKSHLVPFGEYIPFQKWIPLAPIVQFKGFQKGNGLQTFQIFDDFSYSPLVCYEIIFPKRSVAKGSSPDFIVNVTNDAWYGESPGPYQHLTIASFRAIEEGIPVIRAANTGISAIIDPKGSIQSKSDTFTQEVLHVKIPLKIQNSSTKNSLSPLLFPLLPFILLTLGIAKYRIGVLKD